MPLAAITDYPSLVANITDFLARNDLEYAYPSWIQIAEKRLNSALKVPGMETIATLALGPLGDVAVPADYIEWVMARWAEGGASTRVQNLRFAEANSPEFTYRFRPNGDPQFYTIAGGKLQIVPRRAGNVELTYYRTLPALTAAAPTNWLITRAPQIYLYSVLSVGYSFQKDEAKAAEWMAAADERLKLFLQESGGVKVGRRAEREAEQAAEVLASKAVI